MVQNDILTAAGIHRLEIPTPFAVGTVNAYLIDDDPLTLVDSGPNWGVSADALEEGLRRHGYAVPDLGLLLVTHEHVDHLGLTRFIAGRCNAEVAAIDVLAPLAASFETSACRQDEEASSLMRRHGVSEAAVVTIRSLRRLVHAWGSSSRCNGHCGTGRSSSFATAGCGCCTGPVTRRPTHSFSTRSEA